VRLPDDTLPGRPGLDPPAGTGRPRWLLPTLLAAGFAVVLATAVLLAAGQPDGGLERRWVPEPAGPDRLVTNELAYRRQGPQTRRSADWVATSGSLFVRDGRWWTGAPDRVRPDAASAAATDSAVFRVVTTRGDFADVEVGFSLRVQRLVSEPIPARPYDGVHVYLRYQDPRWLYAVSVGRRDGRVAIKKKLPGGPGGRGDWVTLASARRPLPTRTWVEVRVRVATRADGSVAITLDAGGQLLQALDDGRDGPPIVRPGRVGLSGDNCEFEFGDFAVEQLS
jgi:hypothetical protein